MYVLSYSLQSKKYTFFNNISHPSIIGNLPRSRKSVHIVRADVRAE